MVLPAILDPTGPLDDSIGALLIGTLVSAVLYGLCLLQAFLYFQNYPKDLWYIKTTVITIVTLDTVHLFCISAAVYHYVITNYHNPSKLQDLTWPIVLEALLVVTNSTIVQIFYIHRAWRLSTGLWYRPLLCTFILLLVCVNFGTSIAWTTFSMRMTKWYELSKLTGLAYTVLVLSCSIDILIAGSLCFLLLRGKTGFKRTDTMINRLLLFVISTGLLTAIFAILALIFLLSFPYNLIYGGFYLCIGRLYTNSFLTTLNARTSISNLGSNETELTRSSALQLGHGTTMSTGSKERSINIQIQQVQEVVVHDEEHTMSESVATNGRSVESEDDLLARKGPHLIID